MFQLLEVAHFISMKKFKKLGKKDMLTPGDTMDVGGSQLSQNSGQPGQPLMSPMGHPMVPMSPSMVGSIKASPKGKIPAGLAKYLANKKKGKVQVKKSVKKVQPGYNFKAVERKLGVVS